MSRIVSVVVKNVLADKDVLDEARKLLAKYGVENTENGFTVRGVIVTVENGLVKIQYDEFYNSSRILAEKVTDALIAATVAKSAKLMGARIINIRETAEGYEIEGWT
jgi:alkyl hydroperoxide reductase subunit AhpC